MGDSGELRRISAELFGVYSNGRLARQELAVWILSLDDYPPAAMRVILTAQQWFSRDTSRRKHDEVMINDLELLLQLSELQD